MSEAQMEEETLATVQSESQARRILDEIVTAGEYTGMSITEGYPVYSREKKDMTEEVTIRKEADRKFLVVKRVGGVNVKQRK